MGNNDIRAKSKVETRLLAGTWILLSATLHRAANVLL
jgi:hypothetical protein